VLRASAAASGRDAGNVEVWQMAALDCDLDEAVSRRKIGAILAFILS
jgi:hypothetical protein